MTRFEWGDTVTRSDSAGIPFLVYNQPRRRVAELLDDAARWGTRPHLIQGTRTLTFDDCFAAIDVVAARLLELGIAPGRPHSDSGSELAGMGHFAVGGRGRRGHRCAWQRLVEPGGGHPCPRPGGA